MRPETGGRSGPSVAASTAPALTAPSGLPPRARPGGKGPPGSERPRWSSDFDWTVARREWFSEGGLVFDVARLKRHLASHRLPVTEVKTSDLADWSQTSAPHGRPTRRAASLRPGTVARADTSLPILLVRLGARRFLVDGHHRLERARRASIDRLPAIWLDDPGLLRECLRERSSIGALTWLAAARLRRRRLSP